MKKIKEEKILMYDDPDIVEYRTDMKGWVSKGIYFGDNKDSEHIARYNSCTHKKCKCGNIMRKHYTKCAKCRELSKTERYRKMPGKKYIDEPLYSETHDIYFNDINELNDYCYDNSIDKNDLNLVICEFNNFWNINPYDFYNDLLPYDSDEDDLPTEIIKAVDDFNKKINEYNEKINKDTGFTYYPGKYRAIFESKYMNKQYNKDTICLKECNIPTCK